ncbi:short-subunit dehydrogenase [Sphaerotilus hippei]|uniref:Short-subunit dehydrogenase n=1 Tax=Sphaerotilus hippei TaxID=744406 RepID=A0A318GWZ0_9BURK|nr:SDR family NAD(P)-dependent oxidoreductase [Sphaerotilus hippei]PXW94210.1 short-subunit dehydrogenase [Sphaerotilus hippei]
MDPALHHPPRHLTLLTGASRGLGLAMARELLARPGQHLIAIARHCPFDELQALAQAHGNTLTCWPLDLTDPAAAARQLDEWLDRADARAWSRVTLINNAGVLADPGPLADQAPEQLQAVLRVGLEAPLLLTSVLLQRTRGWPARRRGQVRVLNISSGLGRRPMAGSAAYCAAKAGLDLFSAAVGLEEQALADHAEQLPVRIVSLAPGVVDTDMQVQLRDADPIGFPDRARFVDLQRQGLLDSPAQAATRVLAWLDRADFGDPVIADVRHP